MKQQKIYPLRIDIVLGIHAVTLLTLAVTPKYFCWPLLFPTLFLIHGAFHGRRRELYTLLFFCFIHAIFSIRLIGSNWQFLLFRNFASIASLLYLIAFNVQFFNVHDERDPALPVIIYFIRERVVKDTYRAIKKYYGTSLSSFFMAKLFTISLVLYATFVSNITYLIVSLLTCIPIRDKEENMLMNMILCPLMMIFHGCMYTGICDIAINHHSIDPVISSITFVRNIDGIITQAHYIMNLSAVGVTFLFSIPILFFIITPSMFVLLIFILPMISSFLIPVVIGPYLISWFMFSAEKKLKRWQASKPSEILPPQ